MRRMARGALDGPTTARPLPTAWWWRALAGQIEKDLPKYPADLFEQGVQELLHVIASNVWDAYVTESEKTATSRKSEAPASAAARPPPPPSSGGCCLVQ